MLRVSQYLIAAVALLALALVSAYFALPWLVVQLAPRFAHTLGVDALSIEIARPGLTSVKIDSVRVVGSGVTLKGTTGVLAYDLFELPRLESLQFATLHVSVDPPGVDANEATEDVEVMRPEAIFAAIPVATFTIDLLTLALPRLDFLAEGSLHLADGQLSFDARGLEPAEAAHFLVEGDVDKAGSVHATFLDSTVDRPPYLVVESQLSADELAIDTSFNLTGYAFELASEIAGIPAGEGSAQGDIHTILPWPPTDAALEDMIWHGTFDLSWQDSQARVRLHELRGRFHAQADQVDAVLDGGKVELGSSVVSLDIPTRYPVDYADGTVTLAAGLSFEMVLDDLRVEGQLRSLQATVNTAPIINLDVDFALSGFALATSGRATMGVELQPGGQRVVGEGTLILGGIELATTFSHDLSESRGRASSSGQVTLNAPLLAGALASWSEPYDLTAGNLAVQMDFEWSEDLPLGGDIITTMSDVAGFYDEYRFAGTRGDLLFRVTETGVELMPSTIAIGRADVGVELSDISLVAAARKDSASVVDMRLQLLGGEAAFSPMSVDLEKMNSAFDVDLQGVDLADVLALEGEDITGTGVLQGRLPIRLKGGLFSMTAGQLSAEPPGGTIRLASALGTATGQPGLDFALQALTNFSYSSLEMTADFAENGDLSIAVHLQGMNPEVENGRPILYNLNISENIPVLLESLRAQHTITDRLKSRVSNTEG